MQTCPRCASGAPDGAFMCPMCGSVLGLAATEAPPPSVATLPPPPAPSMQAPPPPNAWAPPPYDAWQPPATAPKSPPLPIMVGAVVGAIALLVVVGIEARPLLQHRAVHLAPTPAQHPTLTSSQEQFLISDVLALAADENARHHRHLAYSASGAQITKDGWAPAARNPDHDVLLVGVDAKRGFCIVAAVNSKAPWLIYDSRISGIDQLAWDNPAEPEAACDDKKVKHYTEVS